MMHNPRLLLLLGGATGLSLVVLGAAMASQMHLAACPLCIWQRIMYLLYAGFAFAGLATWERSGVVRGAIIGLMALCAAVGGGIAAYQVWIQRFAPMTSCAGKEPWWESVVSWLGKQVPFLFEASGLCSDPAWKFLELSIAEWSLLLFAGLFGLAAFIARVKK